MTRDEFKTIYWWEWTHRALGRLIGVAFLLPFLWFLWRGWIAPGLRTRLWLVFGLGALQGAIGWWMVASGLAGRVDVSQYRLAVHLTLACIIFAALLWCADSLTESKVGEAPPRVRGAAAGLLVLIVLQIYLGALVAGLDAGLIYNTWPMINGAFVPPAYELFSLQPAWHNFFENRLTVQFDHRMAAYLLWLVALWHALDAGRMSRGPAATGALILAAAITVQAAIGVITLLHQAPLSLALLHQAMAMVVLAVAVIHARRLFARPATAHAMASALPSRL